MLRRKRVALSLIWGLTVPLCVEATDHQAISYVTEQGLMSEIKSEHFMPNASINPQEFILVIGKAFGIQPLPIDDENNSIPIDSYVLAFERLSLLQDLHMDRSEPIQRQEAALILHRLFQSDTTTTSGDRLVDFEQITLNMREAVLFVIGKGWMNTDQSYFHPQNEVTREELAAIAKKVYEYRKSEETKRSWTVYPSLLKLSVGEQQQISVTTRSKIPYTIVFGWDNPAIGTLTAEGLFMAHFPGQGLITVSAGNHRQQIYVKVVE